MTDHLPARTRQQRPSLVRPGNPAEPWRPVRLLAATLTRSLATAVLLVFVYYELPLDRQFGWNGLGFLLGGLAVVGVLVVWQVRSVLRSPFPALRAMEALALTLTLFLLLFASVYVVLAGDDPHAFSQPLTRTDGLYFVVTVFATVGFGDITPVSQVARALTTVQMISDLLFLGLVIRAMLVAVQRGADHRRVERETGDPPPADGGRA